MNADETAGLLGGLLIGAIILGGIVGWVMNIISVIHTVSDPITGMFILRCLGIIFAPLGAILGWF